MCEDKMEIVDRVEQELKNVGMSVAELVFYCGKKRSDVLRLSDDMQSRFMETYDKLEQGNHTAQEKGRLLEQLAAIMFDKKLFHVLKNCRTTTNELDVLVEWTEEARWASLNSVFPCFGNTFICECKNYSGRVGVTYVGKFLSLLSIAGTTLGIFISWHGVTGENWSDAVGLIKKAALAEKIYVIVIDRTDFKQIYDGKTNTLSMIFDKYKALQHDIDYKKWITKHEVQDKLIQ